MTDEYWKKRAKQLEKQHVESDISSNSLEKMLAQVQRQTQNQQQPRADGGRELDLTAILMSRLAAGGLQSQNMGSGMVQTPIAPQGNVVALRPGYQVYRELQGTSYSSVSLAVAAGDSAELSGKQMEIQGPKEVYILENQHEAVDLSKIDASKLRKLISIKIPWIGNVLVAEGAVARVGLVKKSNLLND